MQCSTTQYNAVQHSAMQYYKVQHSTMQFNTVQCSTIKYFTVQCNTMQCHAVVFRKLKKIPEVHQVCNKVQIDANQISVWRSIGNMGVESRSKVFSLTIV